MKQGYGGFLSLIAVVGLYAAAAQAQTISTVAGTGTAGYSGDNMAATNAELHFPDEMAFDVAGNLYIADSNNNRIRKVSTAGVISTVAGNGLKGYGGDDGMATNASLNYPSGVSVDAAGNLYIADTGNHRIRKVEAGTGVISTVAGTGVGGYGGDDGAAADAQLNTPLGMMFDAIGNLYIADSMNNRIRKVTADGIISTVAGNGAHSYGGDGGLATGAQLAGPQGLTFDAAGNLYIADTANGSVRKVAASTGLISTVVGTGSPGSDYHEGEPATSVQLIGIRDVAFDTSGNLYIAETPPVGDYDSHVRKVAASTGIISTLAGVGGNDDYSGDGGMAGNAQLAKPQGLTVDAGGNLYIADRDNHRIRKITETRADLVWRNGSNGANEIWKSANSATKQAVASQDPAWTLVGTGDFDGSGRADLLWRNPSSGANEFWKSADVAGKQTLSSLDSSWKVAGTGDFNGDGHSDILWRHSANGTNVIWRSGDSATLQPVATMKQGWDVAGVGDFNEDGYSDILWRNALTGSNMIWRSADVESQQAVAKVKGSWIVAGMGDFDGDGASDVLWRNNNNGQNAIWRSADSATPQAVSTLDEAWKAVGVADIDDDGQDDIVWRNPTSGAGAVWKSADSAKFQALTKVSDLDWSIVGVGAF